MVQPIYLAILFGVVAVLAGMGYLAGQGEGPVKSTYLLLVSSLSLAAAAVGLVVALDGLFLTALPGQIQASRAVFVPSPGPATPAAPTAQTGGVSAPPGPQATVAPVTPGSVPTPGGSPLSGTRVVYPQTIPAIRATGVVRLFRGLVVLVVAGLLYLYHRRLGAVREEAWELGKRGEEAGLGQEAVQPKAMPTPDLKPLREEVIEFFATAPPRVKDVRDVDEFRDQLRQMKTRVAIWEEELDDLTDSRTRSPGTPRQAAGPS